MVPWMSQRVAWLLYRQSCIVMFCPLLLSANKNGDYALMLGTGFGLMSRYHVPYFDVNWFGGDVTGCGTERCQDLSFRYN
jgi:hypothetical protein